MRRRKIERTNEDDAPVPNRGSSRSVVGGQERFGCGSDTVRARSTDGKPDHWRKKTGKRKGDERGDEEETTNDKRTRRGFDLQQRRKSMTMRVIEPLKTQLYALGGR